MQASPEPCDDLVSSAFVPGPMQARLLVRRRPEGSHPRVGMGRRSGRLASPSSPERRGRPPCAACRPAWAHAARPGGRLQRRMPTIPRRACTRCCPGTGANWARAWRPRPDHTQSRPPSDGCAAGHARDADAYPKPRAPATPRKRARIVGPGAPQKVPLAGMEAAAPPRLLIRVPGVQPAGLPGRRRGLRGGNGLGGSRGARRRGAGAPRLGPCAHGCHPEIGLFAHPDQPRRGGSPAALSIAATLARPRPRTGRGWGRSRADPRYVMAYVGMPRASGTSPG